MALEAEGITLPAIEPDDFRDLDNSAHMRAFDELQKAADELPEDEVVGQIIRWQVADGFAYYKVVSNDPLTVSHIPFLDGWRVDPIMIKGLDADDVRQKVRGQRGMARLFGGSK